MMTMDQLAAYGADVETGLTRCMGNEGFYLRLIGMTLADPQFQRLEQAVRDGDLTAAFEAAHSLKGVTGNLSLDPIYRPASALTELLRTKQPGDYGTYVREILAQRERLMKLMA